MHDALCREGVERLAIAGPGPRGRWPLDSRRWGRRVGQGLGGQEIAAAARAVCVAAAPDLGRPVGGLSGAVECGARGHDHRRAHRLKAELLLAPPAHPDRLPRPAQRDNGGVGRRVVGPVMPVAARSLHMLHRDRGRIELQGAGERGAQRVDPLAMRPDL